MSHHAFHEKHEQQRDWPYVNVIRGMAQLYFPGMRGIAIFQKR